MTKTTQDFLDALGERESGGFYGAVNKFNYLGKYQMGEPAMVDAGYYVKPSQRYDNSWTGEFTGKDGVYSMKQFLNNEQAQENAQRSFKKKQWGYLKATGADKYLGQLINGHEVTQSGLLAAAHLKGVQSVMNYLKSNGKVVDRDAFGTGVEEYLQKFGGYDASEITGIKDKYSAPEYRGFRIGIEKNFDEFGNEILD